MASRKRPAHHSREGGARAKKPSEEREGVEVVCRLSPYDFSDPCVVAIDDCTVRCSAPLGLVQRNGGGLPPPDHCFKFGYVFDDSETQKRVFERCSLDLIDQLITARNALLFTYGVTGSGKTYTMTGNPSPGKAGILPRTLDVIFNSIDNITPSCTFFPMGRNSFGVRDAEEAANLRRETPLLNSSDVEERPVESAKVHCFNDNYACAVFVSYIEIYNDVCYDLLDELPDGSLPRCAVREDMCKRAYVEGAREVEVANADEAMLTMATGDARRRRSATLLNADSSRSHSVFTVKLVLAPCQPDSVLPVVDAGQVLFGQLSLVDLAGSERQKRTLNTGDKLAEASSINNSLGVLRRCIQQLRTNQRSRRADPVPFREMKLTHLFKMFFEGGGKIRMIVCVNPRPTDYAENINVLGFGEASQKVTTARGAEQAALAAFDSVRPAVPRRFYTKWSGEIDRIVAGMESDDQMLPDWDELGRQLQEAAGDDEGAIQRRRAFLSTLISLNTSTEETMLANRSELEPNLRGALCTMDYTKEELEKAKEEVAEGEAALARLAAHNKQLARENRGLRQRLAEREEVDEEMLMKEEDMRRQRKKDAEKLRMHREGLNQMLDMCTSPSVAQLSEKFGGSQLHLHQQQPQSSKMMDKTATTNTASSTESRRHEREAGRAQHNQGVFNPKYQRRSKSAPRVMAHQPTHAVPTGGVLRPRLPPRARQTTRPDAAELERCTDYLLTHQEVNENGDIDTSIYKGECIPTAGGGTAVRFNDVERMTHESPNTAAIPFTHRF